MSFYNNGVPLSFSSGTGPYAAFHTPTPTGHGPQNQNASSGNGKQNSQRTSKRGNNKNHARGHRREPIKKPATQQRPREPGAVNKREKNPVLARKRGLPKTSITLREPRRGRRGQMRQAQGDNDFDMPDAPPLEQRASEDIIMRDAPEPRMDRRKGVWRVVTLDLEDLKDLALKIERKKVQRDMDNDVIMTDAPPLAY